MSGITRSFTKRSYALVVIGGGLAGCCAAIAAARHGATVALVQDRPMLGGNSSSEVRVPVCGACWGEPVPNNRHARETGIVDEITTEYAVRDPAMSYPLRDLILREHIEREKRIDLYLNYRACDVVMKNPATIAAVRCEPVAVERPLELEAGTFIDASGDGWIAALAGAEWRMGREGCDEFGESLAPEKPDNSTLCSSLQFTARDVGRPVPFRAPEWAIPFDDERFPHRRHANYDRPQTFWWLEYGGVLDTIGDAAAIHRRLIAVVMGVWDHIKNSGTHDAETLALDWIGAFPGKRESRRFIGDHILTQRDIESRERFDDRIAYGGWWIDEHYPEGVFAPAGPNPPKPPMAGVYSIPFRSLYSRNVSNLLFAGRNVSASHIALCSIRVMRTLSTLGQAAGTAAAMCASKRCNPRDIARDHIRELQQRLLRDDAYIIGLRNEDPDDLALRGKAMASSEWHPSKAESDAFGHTCFSASNALSGIARPETDESSNLWSSDPADGLPQSLTIELPSPADIASVHLRFDANLDTRFLSGPPPDCARDYSVEVHSDGKWREAHREKGNYRRHRIHAFVPLRGDAVRISVHATNGGPSARIYEMRAYSSG